ncbi:MAG: hypothetical protein ACPGLV_10995 [Bacteroidia bacterium]
MKETTSKCEIPVAVVTINKILALENKYENLLVESNCSRTLDSIQRTRIQQQIFIIEHFDLFKNSIIWQVDDDMIFGQSRFDGDSHDVLIEKDYFSDLINLYTNTNQIDCLIAPSTYIPPIPSLLYCRTQLYFLFNSPIEAKHFSKREYHDYYSKVELNSQIKTSIANKEIIIDQARKIILGYPITMHANNFEINEDFSVKSRLLRGGNFIVFNPEIFFVHHLGYFEKGGLTARRSDMIHAHLLSELGFEIRDTNQLTLIHNRNFDDVNILNCIEKYRSDMIGALLIQYIFNGYDNFYKRLEFHRSHIDDIVNLVQQNLGFEELAEEIFALQKLDESIQNLDERLLIDEFEKFRMKKNELIVQRCKLV